MDATAVGGEDAEAPVADLVAEALDHDRLVGGHDAGRGLLLAQVGDEVLGGAAVEVVLGGQLGRVAGDRLAGEGADRLAQLGGAADPVALPEGDGAGGARRGSDDDPVAGDLLDPPGRRAEQEGLAGARLVDHLLVELADPAAVGQVDAVEAAVGNRAGVGDDQLAGAFAAVHLAGGAVPDDPRAQLGEAVGRVAPVEHVEDVLQLLAGEVVEGLGGGDQALDLVDVPLVEGGHRDEVLGEHVERVLRDDRLLDLAVAHPRATTAHSSRSPRNLGKMRPLETSPRPWPARPIRCRPRVTDFGDSTWMTRSTAPMSMPSSREEVATRHGKLAGLEHLLDDSPLLVGERPVVCAARSPGLGGGRDGRPRAPPSRPRVPAVLGRRQLLPFAGGQLVEALRQPLGRSAGVDEDDRRVVLPDQLSSFG